MEVWKEMGWILEVLSNHGVTYKIRSKGGQVSVSHHDKLKSCVLPANQGIRFCPVLDTGDITFAQGETGPKQVEGADQNQPSYRRPAHLMQSLHPPLRFGNFITH